MNQSNTAEAFTGREFRDALSTFATGVTIVTARDGEGEPVGMTASSFNSVSVDPPLVLWSVTKTAFSAEAFRGAKDYAIHILGSDQVEISNGFARAGADKFAGIDTETNAANVPVLAGACCRLDCKQWAVYEGGDHWIIVGEVKNIERTNGEPLVFSGGSYATANPIRPPVAAPENASGDTSPIDNLLIYNLARAYHQLAKQYHASVREVGLSVPEWRILASLHGGVKRKLDDLSARTFVEPWALEDMIHNLTEQGLCHAEGSGADLVVSSTDEGHARIESIFVLGENLEKMAVGGGDDTTKLDELISSLQTIIDNTDEK